MPNLNKTMLMGNLTRDPELRYTPNNTAVCNIGLAINRKWKNKDTQQQEEETTFIDIEFWGKSGEAINQYLKKGRPLYVEGRLKLDQWEDKEGKKRSKLKVVGESFQFIDAKPEGQQQQQGSKPSQGRLSEQAPPAQQQGNLVPDDDDVPF